MRDFHITSEPDGGEKSKKTRRTGALPFVIQKHAASHLHYDFRLGWAGVLKSWAVAKGPSYYTGDRRLAVQVEDHPMEYGGFEGIIPQGQYGGGTVMVWDQGTWTPQPGYENVDAGLRDGSLKFVMNGTKMHGKWTLVRMGGKAAEERKPNWLLIKEHDEFERGKDDACITEEAQNSAVTGRSLEQIARHEDHVWNSKESARGQDWYRQEPKGEPAPAAATRPAAATKSAKAAKAAKASKTAKLKLDHLPKESQPAFIAPQLALEAKAPPENDGWFHELKLDGYRIQARKDGASVQMLTRSGLDWTARIPAVAAAVAALPVARVTLDGEVVVLGPDGTTNFADLQASFQEGAKNPLTYFCFDLLHIEGRNPRELGLRQRKELLAAVLQQAPEHDVVRFGEHLETDGLAMFHKACELHAEGIVSKRASAKYSSGRGGDWLKSKCLREQEFVIGGWAASSDGDDRIGSLLLGYYRDGKLIYAGRTGTGFTQKMRKALRVQLEALRRKTPAYTTIPADARRGVTWVEPELVAQVRFATWTADDLVRQAAFLGLREDKAASEVEREAPTVAPKPKAAAADRRPAVPPQSPSRTAKKTECATADSAHASGDKVVDAETHVSKRQLAEYYWAVAKQMLPHIAGRPLSLVRCPEGSTKPCFYQKHATHMLPPGVGSTAVPDKKTGKIEQYITIDTPEAIVGLAQMGVLEVHPWGSRNDDLEHPDRIVIDLDPDEAITWEVLRAAALDVRDRLKKIGLTSFLKTTGGKGLHVVVPIVAEHDWTAIKDFTHRFVLQMERAQPALYLTKMSKAARRGKIFLDYLRNERGATAVAPFSTRARAGLGVSLPLDWKDLDVSERPRFQVSTFAEWQSRLLRDPWKRMSGLEQHLNLTSLTK